MNKSDLNNLHDSDVLELLDLVREHGKNPDLWFKLSDMISTDVESGLFEEEYVIVWQDMEFNYHQREPHNRVFNGSHAADMYRLGIVKDGQPNFKSYEVMRKRDFDYLQKQLTNDNQ
jgi:hypothetical protein